jgi:hypothetical protein
MKKILTIITMMFVMAAAVSAQETDNTYWHQEVDVN